MKYIIFIISFIELCYLMILPFMGYIGTAITNARIHSMHITGIAILMVYQILGFTFWHFRLRENNVFHQMILPISVGISTMNYFWLQENFWLFWVEKSLFEVGAICISVTVIGFIGRDYKNKTMSQSVGTAVPVILSFLFLCVFYEFAKAWTNNYPYNESNKLHLAAMIFSFVLDVIWIYPMLSKLAKRKVAPVDLSASKAGLGFLMVEVVIWIFVIPYILYSNGFLYNTAS